MIFDDSRKVCWESTLWLSPPTQSHPSTGSKTMETNPFYQSRPKINLVEQCVNFPTLNLPYSLPFVEIFLFVASQSQRPQVWTSWCRSQTSRKGAATGQEGRIGHKQDNWNENLSGWKHTTMDEVFQRTSFLWQFWQFVSFDSKVLWWNVPVVVQKYFVPREWILLSRQMACCAAAKMAAKDIYPNNSGSL